jgi:TldD protein
MTDSWTGELTKALHNHRGYAELRVQENRTRLIALTNGHVLQNSYRRESGVSARSYAQGAWGFASAPQTDASTIQRMLALSEDHAQRLQRLKHGHAELPNIAGAQGEVDNSTQKPKRSVAELMAELQRMDQTLQKRYPHLKSRSVQFRQQDFSKDNANSAGSATREHYSRSHIYISLAVDSAHGPVQLMHIFGGPGEIEDNLPSAIEFESAMATIVQQLAEKAQGVHARAGVHDVILDSRLAGILAHEAIGHTVEADLVQGGSVAGSALGQQVASPLVHLVDFAHTMNGTPCPMPVFFDDEGTPAQDTWLIQDGILKGFMHNKASAAEFSARATGHARAWGFSDEPLIRMRNTAILPGTSQLADMISSVEDGYFLMDHSNGQADSTSEFMFGVTKGYEIKNGQLGRAIFDTTISGVAFDMLKTITHISSDITWVSSGTCGKKQPMVVGMGGPAIKCRLHIGGR